MTIAQRIGRESASIEARRRADEFCAYGLWLMQAKADPELARAAIGGLPARVKAAVTGATGDDTTWAAPLAELTEMSGGFLAAMATASAFDSVLPDTQRAQLHSGFGVVTANATAFVNLQGAAKKLSSLTLAHNTLVEKKVAGLIVLSSDLLRLNAGAADLVGRSLRTAVASATDESFIDGLIAAAAPAISGSGTDASGVWDDLRAMFDAVETGDGSRLHVIVSPTTAKFLSLLATSSGAAAFPNMSPLGGQIAGVSVHISTHADANIVVIDASAVVAASEVITLRAGDSASIEMDDAPAQSISTGSPEGPEQASGKVVSMFQTNSVALLAERFFGFELVRTTGLAVLDAGAWPASGSPLV